MAVRQFPVRRSTTVEAQSEEQEFSNSEARKRARIMSGVDSEDVASQPGTLRPSEARKRTRASSDRDSVRAGAKWIPGAEPVTVCLSCNNEFPRGTTSCPNCEVALSDVHKCPECHRVQSTDHAQCLYCSSPLVVGAARKREIVQLQPPSSGDLAWGWVRLILTIGTPQLLAAGLVVFVLARSISTTKSSIGQSYILEQASLRKEPSLRAPVIQKLEAAEKVNITQYAFDDMGNHWFGISGQGIDGYVLAREVAPPKATEPEEGSKALRHSLLALDNTAVLPEAAVAVDYFRSAFPASPHGDELRWLLAERTRALAEHSDRRQALLRRAGELYAKIAQGNGQFAEPARRALAQLPPEIGAAGPRPSTSKARGSTPMDTPFQHLTVVGGSLSTRSTRSSAPGDLTLAPRGAAGTPAGSRSN